MILTYAQIESTLAGHLRVHPDKLGTLRARIKQLQKLQFPPGVNVGRGTKMAYSGAHLFQLLAAFELINIGLPAATATGLVTPNWRQFAAGFARAMEDPYRGRNADVFIRIGHYALEELTGGLDRKGWISPVYIDDLESLTEDFLPRDDYRVGCSLIMICASEVVRSVIVAAERFSRIQNMRGDDEFKGWAIEYSKEDYWMRAGGAWKTDYQDF
ncbi:MULTISPECIES: hypothetical protein [unclassified Sphingobium]|uniref:hypothetical protein n=1 Tax=unclassified Sphingobium TaxID=2611147 RepID=UPI000D4F5045|nr:MULTISPECIES: hypothetical protein [unclassified Sphingobium]PSO12626.1 hypothetical protein C7E20_05830 [Sphingobium sp. AEW4]TWD09807.1 hypothetical protein FB595_104154 [Sphingobium sp. AEW010]TWD26478.1 hypothetical protein FB596_104154 [Sphingobium sp. AEW013]TWD27753.1 hypothetical protein FB594_105174 [Sphingobium sp. AEW001]